MEPFIHYYYDYDLRLYSLNIFIYTTVKLIVFDVIENRENAKLEAESKAREDKQHKAVAQQQKEQSRNEVIMKQTQKRVVHWTFDLEVLSIY